MKTKGATRSMRATRKQKYQGHQKKGDNWAAVISTFGAEGPISGNASPYTSRASVV